ncbi:MAG TPA: tRNA 5-methoxyuridine(34)/uridine 5-oxyacetic acid(34) synthase CmoB [Gammaproteobacteria bacterium]|nr:tRNA 5-methoxyuridine(34)/uridine 5-oxyacetic acid(34) synthase CmoB [Gammaproteobacteria bacterium]
MFDYQSLYAVLEGSPLAEWTQTLRDQIEATLANPAHKSFPEWRKALAHLPVLEPDAIHLQRDNITIETFQALPDETLEGLRRSLEQFKPWRKGPFDLHGIVIETEWRSDFKWKRLAPHIQPLKNRHVLDVGCGSGYHCWRMVGEGAKLALGIDTSLLYLCQYWAVRHLLGQAANRLPAYVVPLGIDDLPDRMAFDTVFSMGVLYHRRSPLDHLIHLRKLLRKGGELVLETLVIEGDGNAVLVPRERYAQMRNVWFIPSVDALTIWLQRCGFTDVTVADVTATTPDEQRKTEWLDSHSLDAFLNPKDPSMTVEGYPAPLRALLTARRPD